MTLRSSSLAALVTIAACARPAAAPGTRAPALVALDGDGKEVDVLVAVRGANATVIEFFSAHCPCQKMHDPRLRELYAELAPRGVRFFAIDAEAGASPERARKEAAARAYPFPLLADPDGVTSRALGATVATYAVVLDRDAAIRYVGGIDSDRVHLTADPKRYLHDAVEDLLAGRSPRVQEARTLGCALER